MRAITSVQQLKNEVGNVLTEIAASCQNCAFPDCQGYPWVLGEEEDELLAAGLRLVQLNGPDGPIYLDTFPRGAAGEPLLGMAGARCPYRAEDGRCTVHADRPLTCHLYPLSVEMKDGEPVWALHRDCEYVQREVRGGHFPALLDRCRNLTERISPGLRNALALTARRGAAVSRPVHMDCYTVLGPLAGGEG